MLISSHKSTELPNCIQIRFYRYLPIVQRYRDVEVKQPLDDDPMKTYLTLEMSDGVGNGLVEMMNATVHWLGIDVPIECVA